MACQPDNFRQLRLRLSIHRVIINRNIFVYLFYGYNAAFVFIKTFPMDIAQVLANTLDANLRVDAERQLNEVCLFD